MGTRMGTGLGGGSNYSQGLWLFVSQVAVLPDLQVRAMFGMLGQGIRPESAAAGGTWLQEILVVIFKHDTVECFNAIWGCGQGPDQFWWRGRAGAALPWRLECFLQSIEGLLRLWESELVYDSTQQKSP